jgi:hypothetical protein
LWVVRSRRWWEGWILLARWKWRWSRGIVEG